MRKEKSCFRDRSLGKDGIRDSWSLSSGSILTKETPERAQHTPRLTEEKKGRRAKGFTASMAAKKGGGANAGGKTSTKTTDRADTGGEGG